MVHPSYRRLDEPPKLAGFSFMQWLALLTLAGAVGGVEHLLALPTQPAISAFTLLVGGPAALMYFSESGRPSLLRLVRDLARWVARPHVYEPGAGRPRSVLVRPDREPTRARARRNDAHTGATKAGAQ
jgi:hypothetical protein